MLSTETRMLKNFQIEWDHIVYGCGGAASSNTVPSAIRSKDSARLSGDVTGEACPVGGAMELRINDVTFRLHQTLLLCALAYEKIKKFSLHRTERKRADYSLFCRRVSVNCRIATPKRSGREE
jgi:hypothetical protein